MKSKLQKYFSLFAFAVVIFIVFTMWTAFDHRRRGLKQVESHSQTLETPHLFDIQRKHPTSERKSILILAYTDFFEQKKWIWSNDSGVCTLDHAKGKCILTYDKERFRESDLVLFHARNMPDEFFLQWLSQNRPTSQHWVYASWESPNNSPDPSLLDDLFNLIWSYRSDADLWSPYGRYEKIYPNDAINPKNPGVHDYTKGKSKLVAWIASNCVYPLVRKPFVHVLRQYIDVHVFGDCSSEFGQNRTCSDSVECLKEYKFYLSLENALCEDYITEKYWGRLGDENVVPVVLGGANYTTLAIPGSYINVMNFKTVKELAEYLHYLDRNATAYNEYFAWRKKFKVTANNMDLSLCDICKSYFLKTQLERKVYKDMAEYWVAMGRCNEKDYRIRNMISWWNQERR